MKTILYFLLLMLFSAQVFSQFEFKGTVVHGSGPTFSGFSDSSTYYTVQNNKIYSQQITSTLSDDLIAIDLPANSSIDAGFQLNTNTLNGFGILLNDDHQNTDAYYLQNNKTKIFEKIILPNGQNGYLNYFDRTAKVYYISTPLGGILYSWDKSTNIWDSITGSNFNYEVVYMNNNKGFINQINKTTSKQKLFSTINGIHSMCPLNQIDYNNIPFTTANQGILYDLKIISDSFWLARYGYDKEGVQINNVYLSNDRGSNWSVAFPFDVALIESAGENDAYAYRSGTGYLGGELYKIKNKGVEIIQTKFKGSISMMQFWDSNNGMILALDTPYRMSGIWRVKNSGEETNTNNGSTGLSVKKQNQANNSILYPNPAQQNIFINLSGDMDYSIIDLVGKIVITGKGTKDNNEIDISFLPKGIYIFRVGEESIKWVKQ